jgi:hypothetical protein
VRCFASLVVLAASALAAAACFPEFGFGPSNEGGGDVSSSRAASGTGSGAQTNVGGDGGAPVIGVGGSPGQGGIPSHGGEGSGGSPNGAGGSTTTGVVEMPSVPCGDGNSVLVECAPGQHCCFSSESAEYDHCGASGSCNDYVFTCNEPSDCATGVCCADEDIFGFTGTISCVTSCTGYSARLCEQASDCNSGETCSQYFSNSYAPEYAPGYKVCKP